MATTDDPIVDETQNRKKCEDLIGENSVLNQQSRMTLQQAVLAGMAGHAGKPPKG